MSSGSNPKTRLHDGLTYFVEPSTSSTITTSDEFSMMDRNQRSLCRSASSTLFFSVTSRMIPTTPMQRPSKSKIGLYWPVTQPDLPDVGM